MKKIPTLWVRDHSVLGAPLLPDDVAGDAMWVVLGEGRATVKRDGTSCLVRDGKLYRRFDRKRGKDGPAGWEPAQEPDSVTGHWPGWVPVGEEPDTRWHREAWTTLAAPLADGTYELCGPKVQGNPERLAAHVFFAHGAERFPCDVAFPLAQADVSESIGRVAHRAVAAALSLAKHEGIVWHHTDGRMAKAKRRDVGLEWPVRVDQEPAR